MEGAGIVSSLVSLSGGESESSKVLHFCALRWLVAATPSCFENNLAKIHCEIYCEIRCTKANEYHKESSNESLNKSPYPSRIRQNCSIVARDGGPNERVGEQSVRVRVSIKNNVDLASHSVNIQDRTLQTTLLVTLSVRRR